MTKVVIRVLAADESLLGWVEVRGEARGDGHLWAGHPVAVPIDQSGTPATVSIHWADVNVEIRVAAPPTPVTAGMALLLPYGEQPLFKVGEMPQSLAPVTVRQSVGIGVPMGYLGVRAS